MFLRIKNNKWGHFRPHLPNVHCFLVLVQYFQALQGGVFKIAYKNETSFINALTKAP